jgi:hypothetical protein
MPEQLAYDGKPESGACADVRQLEDTLGNASYQFWVLQVVGSNLAAPTKYLLSFSGLAPRVRVISQRLGATANLLCSPRCGPRCPAA